MLENSIIPTTIAFQWLENYCINSTELGHLLTAIKVAALKGQGLQPARCFVLHYLILIACSLPDGKEQHQIFVWPPSQMPFVILSWPADSNEVTNRVNFPHPLMVSLQFNFGALGWSVIGRWWALYHPNPPPPPTPPICKFNLMTTRAIGEEWVSWATG